MHEVADVNLFRFRMKKAAAPVDPLEFAKTPHSITIMVLTAAGLIYAAITQSASSSSEDNVLR